MENTCPKWIIINLVRARIFCIIPLIAVNGRVQNIKGLQNAPVNSNLRNSRWRKNALPRTYQAGGNEAQGLWGRQSLPPSMYIYIYINNFRYELQ